MDAQSRHHELDGIHPDFLEHCLYHVLVARLESVLNLDPCPAIKLSGQLTNGLVEEALAFSKFEDRSPYAPKI